MTVNHKHLLEIRDLQVVFHTDEGDVQAVDRVSFGVKSGATLGIVGESGCGKSVTALSIMRLIPSPPGEITSGQVLWKDKDLLRIPYQEITEIRGREIAMIFQDPMTSLNPVMTVGSQMAEVLNLRFHISGKKAADRIREMLDLVGIPDPESRIGNYPHELSGGMMQRIMIAMALLCEPDLLIADEPTTALDVTIQAQILDLMKQLQRRKGMALMLITHNMGIVAETCDDALVMYAGRIMEGAPVRELFARSRHPYTRGLLSSIPKSGMTRDLPLPTIEGSVPSFLKHIQGCPFADRCFRRKEKSAPEQKRCYEEDPPLVSVSSDHTVACHYPLDGNNVMEGNPS